MNAGTRHPEATQDYSNRRGALPGAVALGLAGGFALVAADLSTLIQVRLGGRTVEAVTGHAQHGWAVLLLGAMAIALGLSALGLRSSATLFGLAVIGLAVVLLALIGDLPDARASGPFGPSLALATDRPAAGFWLELAGGALLLVGGGCGFILRVGRGRPARRSRETAGSGARPGPAPPSGAPSPTDPP